MVGPCWVGLSPPGQMEEVTVNVFNLFWNSGTQP